MGATLSFQTLRVLAALLRQPEAYGLEIASEAGLKSGSLYPILHRLEAIGWISGRREEIDEAAAGRRRRCYYKLTEVGRGEAFGLLGAAREALRPSRNRQGRAVGT